MVKIRRFLFSVCLFFPVLYALIHYISSCWVGQIDDFSVIYDSFMYFKFDIFYQPLYDMVSLINNSLVPDGLQLIICYISYFVILLISFIVLELICFFTDLAFRSIKRSGL